MVKNQARFTGDEDRALQEIMREAQARCEAPRDDDPKPGRGPSGVRWKTVVRSANGAISGVNWMALAPVPITPRHLSVTS